MKNRTTDEASEDTARTALEAERDRLKARMDEQLLRLKTQAVARKTRAAIDAELRELEYADLRSRYDRMNRQERREADQTLRKYQRQLGQT